MSLAAHREDPLRCRKESDEFDYKRAEADTAATRTSVYQLELDLERRTNALGLLLGRLPQDLVDNAIRPSS